MTLRASDIMRKNEIVTVSPHTTVEELDRILVNRGISGAPVVNASGELIGLVSQRDIVKLVHEELKSPVDGPTTVAEHLRTREVVEIMETRLHSVDPDTDISTVAKILRKNHIHRVPVVDKKKLVGIITTLDLIRPFEDPELVATIWDDATRWRYWSPFRYDRERERASKSERPGSKA